MTIFVCIGSACHLHGSYEVISALKRLIPAHGLTDKVELKASFCMGHCSGERRVSVRIDDGPVLSVDPAQTEDFFQEFVLRPLGVQ